MAAVGKLGWRLLGVAFAVPTGYAVRKVLDTTWRAVRRADPPKDPAAPGTAWGDALAWAAASGVAVAAGRLVATRGATAAWRALTGKQPPGVDEAATAKQEAAAPR